MQEMLSAHSIAAIWLPIRPNRSPAIGQKPLIKRVSVFLGELKNGGNGPGATRGLREVVSGPCEGPRSTYGRRGGAAEKAVGSTRFTMSS